MIKQNNGRSYESRDFPFAEQLSEWTEMPEIRLAHRLGTPLYDNPKARLTPRTPKDCCAIIKIY
jgi:hypothetical protein